jgi:hypothetical protein
MIFTDLYNLLTRLTFYGGVNEIGGNKILLEDKDTKVFLDFGKGFSRRAKFFEEYINPRVANGIEDFLTMGLLLGVNNIKLVRLYERFAKLDKITDFLILTAYTLFSNAATAGLTENPALLLR